MRKCFTSTQIVLRSLSPAVSSSPIATTTCAPHDGPSKGRHTPESPASTTAAMPASRLAPRRSPPDNGSKEIGKATMHRSKNSACHRDLGKIFPGTAQSLEAFGVWSPDQLTPSILRQYLQQWVHQPLPIVPTDAICNSSKMLQTDPAVLLATLQAIQSYPIKHNLIPLAMALLAPPTYAVPLPDRLTALDFAVKHSIPLSYGFKANLLATWLGQPLLLPATSLAAHLAPCTTYSPASLIVALERLQTLANGPDGTSAKGKSKAQSPPMPPHLFQLEVNALFAPDPSQAGVLLHKLQKCYKTDGPRHLAYCLLPALLETALLLPVCQRQLPPIQEYIDGLGLLDASTQTKAAEQLLTYATSPSLTLYFCRLAPRAPIVKASTATQREAIKQADLVAKNLWRHLASQGLPLLDQKQLEDWCWMASDRGFYRLASRILRRLLATSREPNELDGRLVEDVVRGLVVSQLYTQALGLARLWKGAWTSRLWAAALRAAAKLDQVRAEEQPSFLAPLLARLPHYKLNADVVAILGEHCRHSPAALNTLIEVAEQHMLGQKEMQPIFDSILLTTTTRQHALFRDAELAQRLINRFSQFPPEVRPQFYRVLLASAMKDPKMAASNAADALTASQPLDVLVENIVIRAVSTCLRYQQTDLALDVLHHPNLPDRFLTPRLVLRVLHSSILHNKDVDGPAGMFRTLALVPRLSKPAVLFRPTVIYYMLYKAAKNENRARRRLARLWNTALRPHVAEEMVDRMVQRLSKDKPSIAKGLQRWKRPKRSCA